MAETLNTWELVNQQFNAANTYANSSWGLAQGFIADLDKFIKATEEAISYAGYTFTPVTDESVSATLPPLTPVSEVNLGEEYPEDPEWKEFDEDRAPVTVPTVAPIAETLTPIDEPKDTSTSFSPPKSIVSEPVTIPVTPAFEYPTEPTLNLDFTYPDKPNISYPSFTDERPDFNLPEPNATFSYLEEPYQSTLLDSLKAKLAADLAAGGTGIGAAAEAAIWANALDRQAELDERLYLEANEYFASRGWNLPSGALAGKLVEAHNEGRRALSKVNNDILVQQSQLTYQNIKDTINAVTALEQILITHSDTAANRAFEAAKYTVEAAIHVFNAKVAHLNARMEAYKTAASVYEVMVRVQGLMVENYTAQLNAVKLMSDIELAKLEVYKGQLQALTVKVDVYKAELQGAALRIENENKRIALYQAEIQAYVARLNAETAKYSLYQAKIDGQKNKVQLYGEKVRGFVAEVEAAKAMIEAQSQQDQLVMDQNKHLVEKYGIQMDAYELAMKVYTQNIENIVKVDSNRVALYEADIKKAIAVAENATRVSEANTRLYNQLVELELKRAEIKINDANTKNQAKLDAIKAGASVTAQMAAGALSSANSSAGLSVNNSSSYDETKDVPTYSHHYSSQDCGCDDGS